MEAFLNKIELLLELIVEVEILHEDMSGMVTITSDSENGTLSVHTWTDFVTTPENADKEFLEHLLPTRGWIISPYSRARAREAVQRRLATLKELNIEF